MSTNLILPSTAGSSRLSVIPDYVVWRDAGCEFCPRTDPVHEGRARFPDQGALRRRRPVG